MKIIDLENEKPPVRIAHDFKVSTLTQMIIWVESVSTADKTMNATFNVYAGTHIRHTNG
jgi:hypothetical protein